MNAELVERGTPQTMKNKEEGKNLDFNNATALNRHATTVHKKTKAEMDNETELHGPPKIFVEESASNAESSPLMG